MPHDPPHGLVHPSGVNGFPLHQDRRAETWSRERQMIEPSKVFLRIRALRRSVGTRSLRLHMPDQRKMSPEKLRH